MSGKSTCVVMGVPLFIRKIKLPLRRDYCLLRQRFPVRG